MPLSRLVRAAEYINPFYMPQLALNIEPGDQPLVKTSVHTVYQGQRPAIPDT